jgi:hypothetical protein
MQPFYPASPLRRPLLGGLVLLVIVLHALGLQTLSTSLPQPSLPEPSFVARVRLASPTAATTELIPLAPPLPTATPKVAKVVAPIPATNSLTPTVDVNDPPVQPQPAKKEEAPPAPSVPEKVAVNSTPPPLPVVEEAPATPEPAKTPAATPAVAPAPTWLSQTQFVWPAPSLLQFELSGTSKGVRYSANASISWKHQDNRYQLRHEIQAFLFGNRSQTSTGQMDGTGLLPTRFGDQFRQEQAAHFDRAKGVLIYSANTPSQALEEGAQDRVSLFFQLTGAMAGTPSLRSAGQQLTMQVVSAKQAELWTFKVVGRDKLSTPLGELDSLQLHRVPRNDYDQKIDIWLSPAHGYVPARIRITQVNGDVVEETLKSLGKP